MPVCVGGSVKLTFVFFLQGFIFYHFVWLFPIHLVLTGYFLYQEVQYASFVGVGIVLLQSPLLVVLSKLFSSIRQDIHMYM